jgi:hypothetical protein
MAVKTAIQRNLPLDIPYTLIGSYYGSIEDGNSTICSNCGKLICNVATVQSKYGKFDVGMDCASTLTGVKDTLDYMQHKYQFDQGKQARATILKMIKKGANVIEIKTFTDIKNFYKEIGAGKWQTGTEPFNAHMNNWKQYPKDTWQNYVLPMIKDLATK